MDFRYRAYAACLCAGLYAAAAQAGPGIIVVGDVPTGGDVVLFGIAQETFVMPPSVLSSTLSPYGVGPQRLDTSAACVMQPSGVIAPNCDITIKWSSRSGSGGHAHNTDRPPGIFSTENGVTGGSTDPGPAGSITDNSAANGVLGIAYISPEASGVTDLTVTGVAVVNGIQVSFGPNDFTVGVRYEGLQPVMVPGLQVNTASDMHDNSNGNASIATIDGLGALAEEFAAILFAQNQVAPPVRITALSLPEGGLFDFRNEWRPPHISHRFGDDADVGIHELSRAQRRALAIALAAAGFTTPEAAASPNVPTANHWHLRLP